MSRRVSKQILPLKKDSEKIQNIPNILTLLRVIITLIILYMIFAEYSLITIAILFIVGMLTDLLDGQIARRTKTATEFGRKFDMLADRFLIVCTALALFIDYSIQGVLTGNHILQIILILSREILSLPFAILSFLSHNKMPRARFIGKLTTFMQGVALPATLLSVIYPILSFSIYLAIATCIIGVISAFFYIKDTQKEKFI